MTTKVTRIPSSLPFPLKALTDSYTYHSPQPTANGPYLLGVDEAGRGPVLGPLVYATAYCSFSFENELKNMGFADSKTLTPETRRRLFDILDSDHANMGWSVHVLSPQAISSGMLALPPTNLNQQSQAATILLIKEILAAGLQVFVDALGPSVPYQALLSSVFPTLEIVVKPKADSIYTIVGAASVAAKVTRDAWIEGWVFEEMPQKETQSNHQASRTEDLTGSGYPSDPKTQSWLKAAVDPTFGFPSFVRFSWATVKVMLENEAHQVEWIDETQNALVTAFESTKLEDKARCNIAKKLHIRSVTGL